MQLLRGIASHGLTVAAVIHQPRQTIADLVDDLILLGKGAQEVWLCELAVESAREKS
jgi:hypothetical protein